MLPLKEKDRALVQKLLAAGCCARCVLRFCCVGVQAAYRRPEQVSLLLLTHTHTPSRLHRAPGCSSHTQETLKELQALAEVGVQGSPDPPEDPGLTGASGPEVQAEPPSKRAKLQLPADPDAAAGESGVCVACLGVLQELCDVTQATKVCVCEAGGKRVCSQSTVTPSASSSLSADSGGGQGARLRV